METYDPRHGPDPTEWLELDESERIALVHEQHLHAREKAENLHLHAGIHAAVETQIASALPAGVRETLARLMREGLDRHDAIHAIGSVLSARLFQLARNEAPPGDPNVHYVADLAALTAERWRTSG